MWQREEKEGLVYYTLPHWEARGAKLIYTCRAGGVSKPPYDSLNLGLHVEDKAAAVRENRRRVLSLFGLDDSRLVTACQTHGTQIAEVSATDGGRGAGRYEDGFPDTDGLFTAESGVVLATFYADCLPIAAFHPVAGVLGMAHSGWRGTLENIGGLLVRRMAVAYDLLPQDFWVATGAGIGPCCYQVDEKFYAAFSARHPGADQWFSLSGDGGYTFDNGLAVQSLLSEAGVLEENITVLPLCTACHQEKFFSYRRDGGKTGRQGLFAMRKGGQALG